MSYEKIETIEELKRLSGTQEGLDCFIALAGGAARSSKHIYHDSNGFNVLNEIDGSYDDMTEEQLVNDSFLGEALKKGCLYKY